MSLSAGHAHSLFLGADGLVHVCGNNSFGQLGTGKMKKSSVPIQVFGLLDPVRFISAGHFRNVSSYLIFFFATFYLLAQIQSGEGAPLNRFVDLETISSDVMRRFVNQLLTSVNSDVI